MESRKMDLFAGEEQREAQTERRPVSTAEGAVGQVETVALRHASPCVNRQLVEGCRITQEARPGALRPPGGMGG